MTRLATMNKRRRRRAMSDHWMREWIRTGVVVETPHPGEHLLMTSLGPLEWMDQHGRIWEDAKPTLAWLNSAVSAIMNADRLVPRPGLRPGQVEGSLR